MSDPEDIEQARAIIPCGVYVLAHDVTNPKPDRRARRNPLRAETWEKGSRWRVHESYRDDFERDGGEVVISVCPAGTRGRGGLFVRREFRHRDGRVRTVARLDRENRASSDDRRCDALIAGLVPATPPATVRDLLERADYPPPAAWILEWLVREAHLTLGSVQAAIDAERADDNAFYGINDE